ncbi:MAG TPA: universal stress protein, partial [Bacteroidetes bacterium]|nr:universal stress protein [Bacteroidota bacterium]
GDPARVILDDSEKMEVDMIIMAKRRHTAIERMLLGSVTNTVAREAHQPVVLMPVADD